MLPERHVRLFRKGSNQTLLIPREFELPGSEAIMRKDGNRLIIESVAPSDLLGLLASGEALDVDFPDFDADLLPLDDVHLRAMASYSIPTSSRAWYANWSAAPHSKASPLAQGGIARTLTWKSRKHKALAADAGRAL